jgi:hypothetical protein
MVLRAVSGAGFRFFNKTTGATFSVANSNEYMLSTNPLQTYIPASTESTSATTGALRVLGGAGIGKNLNVGGDLSIQNELLYFKATTGTSKLLKQPLYTWSFTVANNQTYTLNLATYGLSNYLSNPYEVRVMFHPSGVTYPVYNITNQAFVYNFDAGYQITYTDSNTMKLRTGDTWVAMIFNHTANAYQYDNAGTYFVYIYP